MVAILKHFIPSVQFREGCEAVRQTNVILEQANSAAIFLPDLQGPSPGYPQHKESFPGLRQSNLVAKSAAHRFRTVRRPKTFRARLATLYGLASLNSEDSGSYRGVYRSGSGR